MGPPKYIVYFVASGTRIRFGLSSEPDLDSHFWQDKGYFPLKPLSQPLPLFEAEQLLFSLTNKPFSEQKLSFLGKLSLLWRGFKLGFRHKQPLPPAGDFQHLQDQHQLSRLLTGKIYLWQELERLWPAEDLSAVLQRLVLAGKCHLRAAVGLDSWGRLVCRRCGSSKVVPNRWCCKDTICFQCSECSALGTASTCSGLVAMARWGEDEPRQVEVKLAFTLTQAQSMASHKLLEFVQHKNQQTCLVWAVCGAGKTEVSYQAAKNVLAAGGRVLFAIPRRSVVQELAERIEKAFQGVQIQALYGGVAPEQRRREAPLVIATTHQVLRFYRNFDLVILDEVDAFPYRDSQMLQQGIERALRPGGKRIFMTATPDQALLKKTKEKGWALVRIPVRPHGHPLPVPEVLIHPSLSERPLKLPSQVLAQIESSQRLFLFVPSVDLCQAVARELGKIIPKVTSCHAQDPKRDQKLLAFRRGEYRVLVATTVAERGITVPGVDVMVLFANRELFQERVLVQMAGRAGRAWDQPTGKVWFVAASQSEGIAKAISQIKEQNFEAERLQLLIAA